MIIHIWHEDSTESVASKLWKFIISELVDDGIEFDIQGMGSANTLLDIVSLKVDNHSINNEDIYIIMMDVVEDNYATEQNANDIEEKIANYKNMVLCSTVCMEYTILKFKLLKKWAEPTWNEDKSKEFNRTLRLAETLIEYVDSGNGQIWKQDKDLAQFVESIRGKERIGKTTIENLSFLLMTSLLNYRKKHFSVTKTELGDCWTCDCCNYEKEKFCNLMCSPLNKHVKAMDIFYKSPLCECIHKAGEELQRRGVDIQL